MGMGYGANYADVIENEDVEEICPVKYKAFIKAIDQDEEETLESFAYNLWACDEDQDTDVYKAYEALQKSFNRKTKLHLELSMHDKEDFGDRYDEVNGAYFCVGGMYQLSPAGKKMEDKVKRKFFVTYG